MDFKTLTVRDVLQVYICALSTCVTPEEAPRTELELKENDKLSIRAIIRSMQRSTRCYAWTDYENSFRDQTLEHPA